MGIRQINGSIVNGKFYSIPEEQYNQIFGKKKGKTNEINELPKEKSKKIKK